MSTHYQIGEFAELGGVSAKTLRFYDEIGVLRPASVDPRTGYRRYLSKQLEDLASIIALKNLGVSLAEVRELTSKRGSPSDRRFILNKIKQNVEQSIQAATESLQWINAALDELAEARTPISVIVKHRQAIRLLLFGSSLRTTRRLRDSSRHCCMLCHLTVLGVCAESCGSVVP